MSCVAMRDIFTDLVDLTHPKPAELAADADDNERDAQWHWAQLVTDDRDRYEQTLRLRWEEHGVDPLLSEIATARQEMLAAEKRMRLLVAYGREFVTPRPYKLDDLAQASGMSISGVRTAYDDDEIVEVAQLTGAKPRQRASPTCRTALRRHPRRP